MFEILMIFTDSVMTLAAWNHQAECQLSLTQLHRLAALKPSHGDTNVNNLVLPEKWL